MKIIATRDFPMPGRYVRDGDEISVTDPEGAELCKKGFARPVAEKPLERAEKRPVASAAEKR